jgi:hypothetical protein
MRGLKYALFLVPLLCGQAYSWWTIYEPFTPSSHRLISTWAVDLTDPAEYLDIHRFSGTIIWGTATRENDDNAHGKLTDAEVDYVGSADAGKFNGGHFERWWDFSQFKHRRQNFIGEGYNAYYYIGLMAHLIQDQAVPAHAANIYHAATSLKWDDLEFYADGKGPITLNVNYLGKEPLGYYYDKENEEDSIIRQTQIALSTWVYPSSGRIERWHGLPYWLANQDHKYTGDAFFGDTAVGGLPGGWGVYGGPAGDDMYVDWSWTKGFIVASPEITQNRLNEAASYTAGMLMAVSRSLPPIVADASLSAPRLVPGGSVRLTFDILENRTTDAYLIIELKDEGGGSRAIISPEYQTGKAETLDYDADPARLPYWKHIELDWDGTLANGEWAPSGERKLVVTARDGDGNTSASVELPVLIDAGGPFVDIRSDIGGCGYHGFQGISAMNPACTNVSMVDLDSRLTVEDPSGGVALVELLTRAGEGSPWGPTGYSRNFDPPVSRFEDTAPRLPDGEYKLVAEDADGNLTEAPFRLGSIYLASDREAAYSVYDPATGMMSVTLTADASGYYDLTGVEAIDELGPIFLADLFA